MDTVIKKLSNHLNLCAYTTTFILQSDRLMKKSLRLCSVQIWRQISHWK